MAGPFRAGPARARHGQSRGDAARAPCVRTRERGASVSSMVSSGDPGVFAMAAAVLEALDEARDEPALDRGRTRDRAGRLGGAGDRGASGCAARPRLLHAVAVRQPEAVDDHRNAPAARGRSRSRDGVLQPDLACAAVATRQALDIVREYRAADRPRSCSDATSAGPGEYADDDDAGELRSSDRRHAHDGDRRVVDHARLSRATIGGEWVYTPRWYE